MESERGRKERAEAGRKNGEEEREKEEEGEEGG